MVKVAGSHERVEFFIPGLRLFGRGIGIHAHDEGDDIREGAMR